MERRQCRHAGFCSGPSTPEPRNNLVLLPPSRLAVTVTGSTSLYSSQVKTAKNAISAKRPRVRAAKQPLRFLHLSDTSYFPDKFSKCKCIYMDLHDMFALAREMSPTGTFFAQPYMVCYLRFSITNMSSKPQPDNPKGDRFGSVTAPPRGATSAT